MKIFVVRHAEAEDQAGQDDAARKLTARGRDRMRQAARGMKRLGLKVEMLLTSPIIRAAATAEIIASVFGQPEPRELAALATGVAPEEGFNALSRINRVDQIMVVGHEPQLSRLVSLAVTGSAESLLCEFKKGGCIALEAPGKLEPGSARMLWMMTNRQLRSVGK
ncbi:MAG TPA: phosphohistidine phosphatase SixA [Candidatus Binataceae bacterium]|jgi:phosphohistidine phosphatase|nr:phosphohistidine phosphatase SixA [Candidatus Binataceae bacterium]